MASAYRALNEMADYVRELEADGKKLREGLSLIAKHARLDEQERGFGEASRYYGIAENVLALTSRTTGGIER